MHLFESSHPLAQQLEETFTRPSGFTKPRKALAMGPWPWGHGRHRLSTMRSGKFFETLGTWGSSRVFNIFNGVFQWSCRLLMSRRFLGGTD